MTANDIAILILALFALVMVVCDLFVTRPRSLFLSLAVIALGLVPIVKRYLFT